MTPRSASAPEAARYLWERASADTLVPEELAAAAERMHSELRVGLGRWIGAEGYQVLLDRALGLVREEYPALNSFASRGADGPLTAATVRTHGAGEVAAGQVALVVMLIELLGRIIGGVMAVNLVDQIGVTNPHGVVSAGAGGPDG